MKRAICLFLAVLCMFNCAAISFADGEIVTLDEPTAVLTTGYIFCAAY